MRKRFVTLMVALAAIATFAAPTVTDVTATPNPDGTVTLTLPRTTDTTQFFRVEVE